MVPEGGLEPPPHYWDWILNRAPGATRPKRGRLNPNDRPPSPDAILGRVGGSWAQFSDRTRTVVSKRPSHRPCRCPLASFPQIPVMEDHRTTAARRPAVGLGRAGRPGCRRCQRKPHGGAAWRSWAASWTPLRSPVIADACLLPPDHRRGGSGRTVAALQGRPGSRPEEAREAKKNRACGRLVRSYAASCGRCPSSARQLEGTRPSRMRSYFSTTT